MTNSIWLIFGAGVALVLLQLLAALPWLLTVALNPDAIGGWWRGLRTGGSSGTVQRHLVLFTFLIGVAMLVLPGALVALLIGLIQDRASLEIWGRIYASILHLQLTVDCFVLIFAVVLWIWPKGGAVALAAFREGLRQPMFWLLLGLAFLLMVISPFIPYFTFGEDLVVVKEMGYDMIMLAAVLFGTLAASISISEEIEGRTAITLMSKPVSRRQFLLGKFFGILLTALVMIGLLGWFFNWLVIYKHWFDRMDPVATPPAVTSLLQKTLPAGEVADFLRGGLVWVADTIDNFPGLVLGFCQVMVLLGVAVALATRLPMAVNVPICAGVYFLGHLSPVLLEIAKRRLTTNPTAPGNQMLMFMARLFDFTLPGMEFFSVGPALVTDTPPPLGEFYGYVGMVTLYGCLYTAVVLVIGLVLFEDRDLA